ncbi:MAG: WecB/TagA/CpsF family glycosyltransferase [Magnetococcales bacterium]|nr:WecB/TagA/CpsF family glycosyltransferase [Magnetococcales bacterium]
MGSDKQIITENILGYPVIIANVADAVSITCSWLETSQKKCSYFVCANPHSLELAHADLAFDQAIKGASLIIPDGIGISIASKISGGQIRGRITGSDMFYQLSAQLNRQNSGKSYFFLGSSNHVLAKLKSLMSQDYPNIPVVGTYSPPFKDKFTNEDNHQMVEAINRANPDVLWVGMTAPKQEKWIFQNKEKLNVSVVGPIGAVFDFYSGTVKRPGIFFQRLGLEWLTRFVKEPRRLWQRNMVSNPRFILRVLASRYNNQQA